MMNPIARRGAAAHRTALLLISLLVAVTAATVFAVPGYLGAHRAVALRAALSAAGDRLRTGITETAQLDPRQPVVASTKALGKAAAWGTAAVPKSLRGIVGTPTVVAMSSGTGLEAAGSTTKVPLTTIDDTPPGFGLRAPYGSAGKLRTVAGQAPPDPDDQSPAGPPAPAGQSREPLVWGWLSQAAADRMRVTVGDRLVLTNDRWSTRVLVAIAGTFAPADPADPWWTDPGTGGPNTLVAPIIDSFYDESEGEDRSYWRADLLLNDNGAQRVGLVSNMAVTWSYPFRPAAITPGNAAGVVADLTRFKTATNLPPFPQIADQGGEMLDIIKNPAVTTPLPPVLSGYLSRAGTAMVVMSLGLAVLAAVAIGVLALAVRLLVHRQRADLVVARARGASLPEVARGVGYQVAAATAGAVAVALAAARAAGSASLDAGSLLLAAGVVAGAFLLAAGQTAAAVRGSTGTSGFLARRLGGRTDAVVRIGLELIVPAVLAAQIMTLRSRGLGSASQGIDPVVATLPVTVALAAGVVLLRLAPLVPRTLALVLGSGRGATGFVATSSARREAVIGPLAAVVILATLSGSVFGATFTRSLAVARADDQWARVGAGARVDDPYAGFGSSLITNADLAAIRARPGITAAAGAAVDNSATFAAGGTDPGSGQPVTLIGLDVAAYSTVITGTPLDTPGLHRALAALEQASRARPASYYSQDNPAHPPLPALLTFGSAPGTGGTVQGTVQYAGMPVTIITNSPALPPGMAPRGEAALVVDYQILKARIGAEPTRGDVWAAGDPAALTALTKPRLLSEVADEVVLRTGPADASGGRELDRLTERVYTAETVLEGLLCALAVLLTLAAGSAARRRAAAFLVTMGFGRPRLRRIAVLEALPGLLVVTAGGLATGLGTVPLLAGSVDLSSLAGMNTPHLAVHTNVAVVAAATIAVPGVALLAVFVEAALRRPMTLISTMRSER